MFAMKVSSAEDTAALGAAELARAIAEGRVRPSEVVEARIARLQEVHQRLNAVVFERYADARREALEADRRVREGGALPPLFGVPITLKECIDLAGAPSTFGVPHLRAPVARDADVVRRLREAGAIVLAKSNVAQMLLFVETDNPVFGRTSHPMAAERSSGGSSGGEAVLVATGASPLGFGTDIGGSVRLPAAFCGIVGFKPTPGRVVDRGRFSVPLGQQTITSQIGVLARNVDDAALGLRVALGPTGDDGRGPLESLDSVELEGLRVAVIEEDGILAPCPAARRALREATAALCAAGAQRVDVQLPPRDQLFAQFYAIMSADRAAHIKATLADGPIDPRIKLIVDAANVPRSLSTVMLRATNRARTIDVVRAFTDGSAAAYFAAAEKVAELRALAEVAMRDVDVVLSPATPLPAVRHGATAELGTLGSYCTAWNVLGFPAGVAPWTSVQKGEESDRPASNDKRDLAALDSERGSAGLPIGVQLAAAPHRDHVALAAMRALERVRPR